MRLYISLLIILIGFRTFNLTPIALETRYIMFAFSLIAFIYNFKLIFNNALLRFILILILISIISSIIIYNQSLVSSVVANSYLISSFAITFIAIWIENKSVDFLKLMRYIIRFAWVFSFIIIIFSVFDLNFNTQSAVSGIVEARGANKLSTNIIYLAFFNYFFEFNKTRNIRYLAYSFWFFMTTQLADIQRGDIVFLVATIFIYIFYSRKFKALAIFIFSIFSSLIITSINFFFSESLITEKFIQFLYFFQPSNYNLIEDAGLLMRLSEILFAIPYIIKSPFFGNGLIRSSNNEIYFDNAYFYVGDIGIIGIIFTFGVIGLIYLIFLIVKSIRLYLMVHQLRLKDYGVSLFLIFFSLYGIKNGVSVYNPFIMLFCFLIVKHIKKTSKINTLH